MGNTDLLPTIDSTDEIIESEMTTKHDRTQALSHNGKSETLYNSVKFDDLRAKFDSKEIIETTNSTIEKNPEPDQTSCSVESNRSSALPTTLGLQNDGHFVRTDILQVDDMSDESGIVEEPTSSVREMISRIEVLSNPESTKSASSVEIKSGTVTPTRSDKIKGEKVTCELEDLTIKEAVVNTKIREENFASVSVNSGGLNTEETPQNTDIIAEENVHNINATEVRPESEAESIDDQEVQTSEPREKSEPEAKLESECKFFIESQPSTEIVDISSIEPTSDQSLLTTFQQNIKPRTEFTRENTSTRSNLVKDG